MDLPVNPFKKAIREGRQQIGIWNSLPYSLVVDILGHAGFDWILLDSEHTPVSIPDLLPCLQALEAHDVHAIIRPASNDPVIIKPLLDLGALTLLVPWVQNADEARAAVSATRYGPAGIRGAASVTRASRYGTIPGYAARASEEICLLVQVETGEAIENIEAIAAVDGIDGIFIGPGDLAANLGHPGEPLHPDVTTQIDAAIKRIVATGKPAGILSANQDFARHAIETGTTFTAVGIDVGLLLGSAKALAQSFR